MEFLKLDNYLVPDLLKHTYKFITTYAKVKAKWETMKKFESKMIQTKVKHCY